MASSNNPHACTREELGQLLETGARIADSPALRAAIHLLTYTSLPGRTDLADHIELSTGELPGSDRPVPAAFVRDWTALARRDGLLYLTSAEDRLLALAASLARGIPVNLRDKLAGLGQAHARRVLEAIAITLGVEAADVPASTSATVAEQ